MLSGQSQYAFNHSVRKANFTFSFKSLLSVDATSSFPLCSINCFSQGSSLARTSASSLRKTSVSTVHQQVRKENNNTN